MNTIFYDHCKNNAFITYEYILINTALVFLIILFIFIYISLGEKQSSECVNIIKILLRHFKRNKIRQCTISPFVEIVIK